MCCTENYMPRDLVLPRQDVRGRMGGFLPDQDGRLQPGHFYLLPL